MESFAPYGLTGSIIAQDRAAIADATAAAVRRRQLLHQRQAHRRGRRPAAVRWRSRVGHQRQGRCGAEPPALDQRALHQGDLRPAEGARVPAHGLRVRAPEPVTWRASRLTPRQRASHSWAVWPSMSMASSMGGAAAFSILPPMSGTLALSSASSVSTRALPAGREREGARQRDRRAGDGHLDGARRLPSAAAGPQSWVSVTLRVSPTMFLAKSGRPSVGRTRSVRDDRGSPRS